MESNMLLGQANTTLAMMDLSQMGKKNDLADLEAARAEKRIDDAAREFEAVFAAEMLKPMFEGLDLAAPFGGGKAEEVFRSIMLQEYGKEIAKTSQLGLAQHVKAELLKMQEGQAI